MRIFAGLSSFIIKYQVYSDEGIKNIAYTICIEFSGGAFYDEM